LGAITPYVAGILFLIIFAWIYSASSLSKQFLKLNAEKEEQAKAAAQAAQSEAMAKSPVQQGLSS
jgi:ATP/ADP translocase